jgi:hypothetical protein
MFDVDKTFGITLHGFDYGRVFRSEFTCNQHELVGQHRLAGYTGIGVKHQNGVQKSIGDLISDFVGMTFDGFRGKEVGLAGILHLELLFSDFADMAGAQSGSNPPIRSLWAVDQTVFGVRKCRKTTPGSEIALTGDT